jgi:hypothetical protein
MNTDAEKILTMAEKLGFDNSADFEEDMFIWAVNHGDKTKVTAFYEMDENEYTELRELWAAEAGRGCSDGNTFDFEVWQWCDDEEGEYEKCIGTLKAISEYHASALLRDRIKYGKYPKGVWLMYILNGEKVELDTKGRIPA